MAEKRKKVFKVVFVSQGQVFEVYAKSVSQGGLFGFVEIEGLLFGVRPTDALTVAAVVAAVGVVGVVATVVPSWRATRIDPLLVLRQE